MHFLLRSVGRRGAAPRSRGRELLPRHLRGEGACYRSPEARPPILAMVFVIGLSSQAFQENEANTNQHFPPEKQQYYLVSTQGL